MNKQNTFDTKVIGKICFFSKQKCKHGNMAVETKWTKDIFMKPDTAIRTCISSSVHTRMLHAKGLDNLLPARFRDWL